MTIGLVAASAYVLSRVADTNLALAAQTLGPAAVLTALGRARPAGYWIPTQLRQGDGELAPGTMSAAEPTPARAHRETAAHPARRPRYARRR